MSSKWTDDEIAMATRLLNAGAKTRDIVAALPMRSQKAVYDQLAHLRRGEQPKADIPEADEIRAAFERGLTDREMREQCFPHRSITYIERARRGLGLIRIAATSAVQRSDETEAEYRLRLKVCSDKLLAALAEHHKPGCCEIPGLTFGRLGFVSRPSVASLITSSASLCADVA